MANCAKETVRVAGGKLAHVIGKDRIIRCGDLGWHNVSVRVHYAISGCGSADRPPRHDAIGPQIAETCRPFQSRTQPLEVENIQIINSGVSTNLGRAYSDVGAVANTAAWVVMKLRVTHVSTADCAKFQLAVSNQRRKPRTVTKVSKFVVRLQSRTMSCGLEMVQNREE